MRRFDFNMLEDFKNISFYLVTTGQYISWENIDMVAQEGVESTGNGVHSSDCSSSGLTDSDLTGQSMYKWLSSRFIWQTKNPSINRNKAQRKSIGFFFYLPEWETKRKNQTNNPQNKKENHKPIKKTNKKQKFAGFNTFISFNLKSF